MAGRKKNHHFFAIHSDAFCPYFVPSNEPFSNLCKLPITDNDLIHSHVLSGSRFIKKTLRMLYMYILIIATYTNWTGNDKI